MRMITGTSPQLSRMLLRFSGGGALGTTRRRLGSCFTADCLFIFEMPSTMLIRLGGSPFVSTNRPFGGGGEGDTETEAVRLWPGVGLGGVVGSRDAIRLRGSDAWRPSEAWVTNAVVRGGALAALVIDCFDSDELRERFDPPSSKSTAATAGGLFNLPDVSPTRTEPPLWSTEDGLETLRLLPPFARAALLMDSVTVSLAYPFSVSAARRAVGGAWTEPRFDFFLSRTASSSAAEPRFFGGVFSRTVADAYW